MENDMHAPAPERVARIERSLQDAEEALTQRYCALGKTLLDMMESEEPAINRLSDEIVSLRKQLSEARGEIVCGVCLTHNPPENRFCRFCGAFLQANAPESAHK